MAGRSVGTSSSGRRPRKPIFARSPVDPAHARVPNGSRPATTQEWQRLLQLHGQILRGGYSVVSDANRAGRLRTSAARDFVLLELFDDGVSTRHLADLLGGSREGIQVALERAGAATGRDVRWRPGRYSKAVSAPRRERPSSLTAAQVELIHAVWDSYRAAPRGNRDAEAVTLVAVLRPLRRNRMTLQVIADLAGIRVGQLRYAIHLSSTVV